MKLEFKMSLFWLCGIYYLYSIVLFLMVARTEVSFKAVAKFRCPWGLSLVHQENGEKIMEKGEGR